MLQISHTGKNRSRSPSAITKIKKKKREKFLRSVIVCHAGKKYKGDYPMYRGIKVVPGRNVQSKYNKKKKRNGKSVKGSQRREKACGVQ